MVIYQEFLLFIQDQVEISKAYCEMNIINEKYFQVTVKRTLRFLEKVQKAKNILKK